MLKQTMLLSLCLSLAWPLYALETDILWQCTVADQTQQQWSAQNIYQRLAHTNAFDACRKNSQQPKSCHLVSGECEEFIHGMSARPKWQCTAFDRLAQTWLSKSYADRDTAALNAKAHCEAQSSKPESCYVNLISCTNINARN